MPSYSDSGRSAPVESTPIAGMHERALRERRELNSAAMHTLVEAAQNESRDMTRAEAARFDLLERELAEIDERLAAPKSNGRQVRDAGPAESRGAGGITGFLFAEKRALAEGTGPGGFLVPDQYLPSFFDRLAPESVGLRSGFRVISTKSDVVRVPAITADAAAAWTTEGATITPTDPTFAEVVATPRKLAALTQMSNELIADAQPDVLDVVEANIRRSIALKLDLGFFEGTGTAPEIRGLKNVSGISTVSAGVNGGVATLDMFADAVGTLASSNVAASAIVMHPRTWAQLVKLKDTTNQYLWHSDEGNATAALRQRLFGVPVYLSSQLSITETQGTATNASSAYVYDASRVVAVRRHDAVVAIDPYRLFNSDQTEMRVTTRWDLVVPTPAAVVRILGLIP